MTEDLLGRLVQSGKDPEKILPKLINSADISKVGETAVINAYILPVPAGRHSDYNFTRIFPLRNFRFIRTVL